MHRVIFFGTSEFAVPHLDALIKDKDFHVIAVVTQPDKPVGRHAVPTPPPIKTLALKYQIPVFQPAKLLEIKELESFQALLDPRPDVGVVVAYGKILPQWVLDIPKNGIINVHASILPRHRGPSPIHATIAAGDQVSGVSIMLIDEQMDHGPILATMEEELLPNDTVGELQTRLADLGAKSLAETIKEYLNGTLKPKEQDHSKATYCKILTRENGKIDWNQTASEIERLVRAYDPWPGTWTEIEGKRLKMLKVRVCPNDSSYPIGTRFLWKGRPNIKCGQGTVLELEVVQPEGKKPMSGEEYIRGRGEWLSAIT